MSNKKEEMLNQSAILELGWTKSLIARFLPEPQLKPNPFYQKAAPMKCWNKHDVYNAMESDEFKEAMKKAAKRKGAAKKAYSTKANVIMEDMKNLATNLKVKVMSDVALRRNTIREHEVWAMMRCNYDFSASDITPQTMDRWIVNYIRHNLVYTVNGLDYDAALERLKGKCGRYEVYPEFKRIILMKISAAYPKYSTECMRQISDLSI